MMLQDYLKSYLASEMVLNDYSFKVLGLYGAA